MKYLIKLPILLLFFSPAVLQAQTFSFSRSSPEIIYAGADTMTELISYGHINNMTGSAFSIRLIRTVNLHSQNWASAVCDVTACYPAFIDTCTATYQPGSGEISVHFYDTVYIPGIQGFGTVTLKAEKVSNPAENYSVTFKASTFPVSIKQISEVVNSFKLDQNYPNPFNPETKIGFAVPKSDFVDLRVYDILGREVKVLLSQQLTAGEYEIEFDAHNLASGMYYYRLQSGDNISVKKMTLVK